MKNNRFDDLIQGFIDGELNSEDEKAFKEHLKSCKECQQKLQVKEKIVALIKDAKVDVDPPKELINRIIASTIERKIIKINWRYVAIGAAATLILFFFLFTYFINSSTPIARDYQKTRLPVVKSHGIKDKEITELHGKKMGVAEVEKEHGKQEGVTTVYKKPKKAFFEETRLVFPEEGSVVGKEFDVVIILKEPSQKVELNIDGEKRIFESRDSNILYIESDSLPALENGFHYLTVVEPTYQKITFFKEG